MNFLNPWYLLAALAAVVPLVIHLLHRQRARVEVFPSLDFLRRMMRKRTRRFRLKQLLLLITRTLLLLVIALALARPTLTGSHAVRGHLPTTAVIILDDSFSMARQAREGTLFEVAKQKLAEVLKHFGGADEVHLVTASSPSRDLTAAWGTRDAQEIRDHLGALAQTDLATDLVSPLAAARATLARSSNPDKEIYVVSDMQKLGWEGLEREMGDDESAGKALLVDLGENDPNSCVEDIGFTIPSGSDDLRMDVTFARFNSSESQGRVAEVYLEGALLARSVFSPGEAVRAKESFRLPASRGFLWGEVALAEDRLPLDDRRYFAVPSRKRVIGLLGDTYYVSKALSPEGGGSFTTVELDEGSLTSASLAKLDALVMSNVARLAPLEVAALADYLAGGGRLLAFVGSKVDIGDYNRNLLPRIAPPASLKIEGLARAVAGAASDQTGSGGTSSTAQPGRGFYTIERVDRGHRIFAKFKGDESPFADARFYTFMKTVPESAQVLAHFSDGSPALIEMGERAIVVTTSADVSWNDLVLTPQFLPIIHEALLYLTSGARASQSYKIGDEIDLKTGDRGGEAYLQGPAGGTRLFPEALGQGLGYRIPPPDVPGVYFLKNDVETLSVFAVNVDTRESDLTKVAPSEVEAKLKHFDTKWITSTDDVGESISLLRRGRDLSRPLVWAGLVLFLFEVLLASNLPLRLSRTDDQDALPNS
ncbi:MAG TPA: BatA and WFA domain-containing protein [bacterium]|nr:BatA and WFA domain-containing protein [bacterium]